MEPSLLKVFFYASLTAVATGLGALPLLFVKKVPERYLGLANAAAAGLMLAASFQLINEGVQHNLWRTILGVLLGLGFIMLSHRFLERFDTLNVGQLEGADAKKALLIMGVMTLHSVAEGIGVGVSYGDGIAFGLFITLAIAVHNIPEGLAISLVLVPRGVPVWRAALWSIVSSLPQPIMAIPAFLFVSAFTPFLPVGLGLAAGAMIWMAQSELVPDALEAAPAGHVAASLTLAATAMVAFQVLIGS